jgi:hypothetical protein
MTLSSREKTLAIAMGSVVLILVSLLLLRAFARRNIDLRSQLDQERQTWASMQELLSEQGEWTARDAAITAKQPKLEDEQTAEINLENVIKDLAKKHGVTVENEVFRGVADAQWYRSVPMDIDTRSTWPDLIAFLYALQRPDQFIVCEHANIQVDASDPTKMAGQLRIARWYAPSPGAAPQD